ncbi:MAG TPA: magnesium/cobalt transporter CorA [Cytophagaceae bacterium]|jgi:magnesium transporter|nr:magnesium/cobalt transporter CorA [Cytophagaceae bacterium]
MKLRKKNRRIPGESPGTLREACDIPDEKIDISVMLYNASFVEEKITHNIDEALAFEKDDVVTWINIDGIRNHKMLEKIGAKYNLHPLLLEDISCNEQRPKLDVYDEHIFIVVKMLKFDTEEKGIIDEQVSFVLGKNYVLSFQEEDKKGDVFNPNRERLKGHKGKIRKSGADYLLYTLLDTIVDNYFIILEGIGGRIEELEDDLIADPSPKRLKVLYGLKREMIYLRKSVWPLREVINKMEKGETELLLPATQIFIRDVYDHTIQVIDTVESYRDVLASMVDIYMSSISNRMNSVIKVLTIISTIFIPLTFVAGVYGMNFDYMPELKWKYGYPVVWIFMIVSVGFMLMYFKKKKWL